MYGEKNDMNMQTNRTILLEEINPQKWDILTLIGDLERKEGLDDEHLKEIHSYLEVHSFKEFLEKMDPRLYLYMNIKSSEIESHVLDNNCKGNENQEVIQCSPQKQDYYKSDNCRVIRLNLEYPFLKMILERKQSKQSGKFVFSRWSDILNEIYPIEESPKLYQMRRDAREAFVNFYRGKGDKKQTVKKNVEVIRAFYINKTAIPMLVKCVQEEFFQNNCDEGIKPKVVKLDDDGTQIKILANFYNDRNNNIIMSDRCKESYKNFLKDICDDEIDVSSKQKKMGCMFLYGDWSDVLEEKEEEIFLYNRCLELYKKTLQIYWNEMKSMLEIILGVYSFFEQYNVKNPKMQPSLVVTNCKNERLCTISNKVRFMTYLKTVNEKNYYEHTIWYAILPRVLFPEMDRYNISRLRFLSKEYAKKEERNEEIIVPRKRDTRGCNELDIVLELIAMLSEVQIQTFISADATEENNFEGFNKNGLTLWQKSLENLKKMDYTDFIVPTYPNFTIIPREQSNFLLGKRVKLTEMGTAVWGDGNDDVMRVWLDGLYVEASYVGVGLLAACQCQNYLIEHLGDDVYEDYPGVNYRIAKEKNKKRTPTTMAREIFTYSEELMEEIRQRAAGLIFAPEKYNVVVMDSTLSFTKDGRVPIATIQTITYMERVIRYQTNDFKKDLIRKFFANTSNSTRMQWQNRIYKENAILKEENAIDYEINEHEETCKLKVKFSDTYRERKYHLQESKM